MGLTVSVDAAQSGQTHSTLHLTANLNFESGRCTAILGHSGAGKTSLLRCIAGLDHYEDAHVQYDDTIYEGNEIFIPPYRRRLGIIFQHDNLFEHLSVIDNLRYAKKRRLDQDGKLSLDSVAKTFQIKHLLNKMPNTLSGGEKQMVALARVSLTSPRALLLDEPFSNIDIHSKALMIQSIKTLCRDNQIPVIFVTHSFDEVAQLADDVVVIEKGVVESSGTLFDVTSDIHHSLANKSNAAVVLNARIEQHDEEFGLTKAYVNKQMIYIKQTSQPIGQQCRIRIAAKDISICLNKPEDSSILNILPVTITEIRSIAETHVLLKLDLDGQHILSRITRKSCHNLNLAQGQAVYAQMKSVALATDLDYQ
ncbi:MAG: molybdenum ABC transporter ATP-binding protein [Pseudomonadales bacterium]|nr:molybdenum ABC transporter ATP-binding protein [Pseudomonadales bacterium]